MSPSAAIDAMSAPVVSEQTIEHLVRHFYARIRMDDELGPIFAEVIPDGDWEPHLQTMMAFWSSLMLRTNRYRGNPLVKHQALAAVRPAHFDRWLLLFEESASAVFPPDTAAMFVDRAQRVADSLKLAMFGVPGLRPE